MWRKRHHPDCQKLECDLNWKNYPDCMDEWFPLHEWYSEHDAKTWPENVQARFRKAAR